jgi:hypothetical protein
LPEPNPAYLVGAQSPPGDVPNVPIAQSRPKSCLQASPNSAKKSDPPRWGSSITSCNERLGAR